MFISANEPGNVKKIQASVTAARKIFRVMRVRKRAGKHHRSPPAGRTCWNGSCPLSCQCQQRASSLACSHHTSRLHDGCRIVCTIAAEILSKRTSSSRAAAVLTAHSLHDRCRGRWSPDVLEAYLGLCTPHVHACSPWSPCTQCSSLPASMTRSPRPSRPSTRLVKCALYAL